LHVWFARRPLVASRAAILGCLLDVSADRKDFLHTLGIHGDPVEAGERLARATVANVRLGSDTYGYPRAWRFTPEPRDLGRVLDPTAGGGSIPLEGARLGCEVLANHLNPVAALLLKATIELPVKYGADLLDRVLKLGAEFVARVRAEIADLYPDEPKGRVCDGYLWARTVVCPYCGGLAGCGKTGFGGQFLLLEIVLKSQIELRKTPT
jgi:putative DNA methylase